MAISRKEIEHIAVLARLDSNGGIFDRLAEDMQGIVGMVDKLAELDLGDITDVINTERKNAFHEDVVVQEFTPDELVKPNAPDFQAGGVAVPRVVE
ncbi:Asp-tRNA(Asn)/Glu-tRNA(Gln) amidotransferase subunit GatC [Butyricicoccus sp. Marseille-Q5471]|uniref:Asp-tRNA(Asn)/Glu-tRNA(Gln) amidotransferase subunit GatC n=1 Tax=Butyricicoccus sp. Marseille-Q5471 TaxID=3039493 RepID=UPI0024BCF404|nr:Asp-tRNA(Asn)/Glu-tRNA(Gln) amidotransferase subunit GatC [Butyricicoccus sp. Marseille-Q5471]